jgi:hypothetical protein
VFVEDSRVKLLRDVCATIVAVAVFLCFLEYGLRLVGVKYDASFYRLDRNLGYELRPRAEGWNVKEHENYVRISSQGLRDREHAAQRPVDVIRVAIVGDSFSEAREVDQGATYWSVMERELNRLLPDGPRIEVINFGVDGYGLAQEYWVIKHKIWQYDPQIVIVSGTLHSFILRSRRIFGTKSEEGPVPYYVVRNGVLELDDIATRQQQDFVPPSQTSISIADLANRSRILSLLNVVRRMVATEAGVLPSRVPGHTQVARPPVRDFEREVLRGPANADFSEAWNIAEDLIRVSQAEVSRHHAEYWLILLDMAPQVDPDAQERAATMRELGIGDLFLADTLLAHFLSNEGILHATPAPEMLTYAEEHHVPLHGFKHRPRNSGHWNEIGHQVAGHLIAQELFARSVALRAGYQTSQ